MKKRVPCFSRRAVARFVAMEYQAASSFRIEVFNWIPQRVSTCSRLSGSPCMYRRRTIGVKASATVQRWLMAGISAPGSHSWSARW